MGVISGVSITENRFTQGCACVPGHTGRGGLCSGVTELRQSPIREDKDEEDEDEDEDVDEEESRSGWMGL